MKIRVVIAMFALLSATVMAETYTMSPKYLNADVSSTSSYSGHPLRVGLTTGSPYGRNAVLVFQMPKIPLGETITGATFTANVADIPGTASFNGNLYSLGPSATGIPTSATYYQGLYTSAPAYLTRLQQNFLTPSTQAGSVAANSGGNAAIAANIQDILDSGYEPYYLMSFCPDFTTASSANLGWDISAEQDPNPPSLTITTTPPLQLGRVLIEYWTGIGSGTAVSDLTNETNNFALMPNSREYSTFMEIPQKLATDSGDRLRGLLCAPVTGYYTFAIASDNDSSLLLSPDGKPSDAIQIAWLTGQTSGYRQFTQYPSQQSVQKYLTAGQVYYIEAQHKSGTDGTSNMSIGWEPPAPLGTGSITLMPTTYVSPYDAGSTYPSNLSVSPIAGLLQPFGHPRLMISPAAVARLAEEVTTGTPLYNANQASSWGRISGVCTTTGTDLMPMGDAELAGPLIGKAYITAPPAGTALLTAARQLENRVYVLSLFYLVQSQLDTNAGKNPLNDSNVTGALSQIYGELQNAQSWGTYNGKTGVWDDNNQLDMAEMTHSYAIAYDWCYSGWTPAQIDFLVNTISVQGLAEIDGSDSTNGYGPFGKQKNQLGLWPYANPDIEGNWGIVCNGGALLGALAILGDETTTGTGSPGGTPTLKSGNTPQAETVLNTLMPALPTLNSMVQFAPDGGWTEGPSYWGFAAQYLTVLYASLETSAATCFTMDQLSGMSSTDSYLMYDTGLALDTSGQAMTFNYSDSLASNYDEPAQQYLGLKYNEPDYSYPENTFTDEVGHYPTDMLWRDNRVTAPDLTAPLSTYYSNMGLISLRSAWGNSNALFAGIKAGYNANYLNSVNSANPDIEHEMEQIGGFVFDALGVRWAESLGSDLACYGKAGYFDTISTDTSNRWQYYRCRAEGSNTLVVNPSLDGGQYAEGNATITNFETSFATNQGAASQQAIIDMSPVYAKTDGNPSNKGPFTTAVNSAKRGFRIVNSSAGYSDVMQVQDEVVTTSSQPIYWFMHTPTSVSISGNKATLTDSSGSNHLLLTIQSPTNGASWVNPGAPSVPLLGTSAYPSGQTVNTGDSALQIHYTTASGTTTNTVTVLMSPYTTAQGSNTNTAPVTPLSSW